MMMIPIIIKLICDGNYVYRDYDILNDDNQDDNDTYVKQVYSPSVLSGLSSKVTGSSFLLPGLSKVAVSLLKSSGRFALGRSIPTSHGLFNG